MKRRERFVLLAAWLAASNASIATIKNGVTTIEDENDNRVIEPSSSFQDEAGWQLISASKTGTRVRTYMKPYPGTKLVAFRGIAILDAHISNAMGLFCDFRLAYQWVDMLESIQALESKTPTVNGTQVSPHFMDCRPDRSVDVVHQVVKLPWPLSNREIVLQRHWSYSEPNPLDSDREVGLGGGSTAEPQDGPVYRAGGAVTVHYHSVLDDRVPLPQGSAVVRAESPHTLWRFQAVRPWDDVNLGGQGKTEGGSSSSSGSSGSSSSSASSRQNDTTCTVGSEGDGSSVARFPLTRVEVQVIVDSKGSIPAWLINQVQRRWPLTALGAFDKLVKGDLDLRRNKNTNTERDGDGSVRTFQPVAHW